MAITLPAQTVTNLHNFDVTDGQFPFAGLVQAANGDLYGNTYSGGASPNNDGTIFKITPSGTLTTVYNFCELTNCTDGATPIGPLVQDSNGNLYGTSGYGGANGRGIVFKISAGGMLTTLYNFCNLAGCADGSQPYAGLVQASNGNLYGTTEFGGANSHGTVFEITPAGTLTTLYSFCALSGCADGVSPSAGLVQAGNGDFYGTTQDGGANHNNDCDAYGCGTVFKITPGGGLTTLHSFCAKTGCADGQTPVAGLVLASNGNFYGTTQLGGADNNNGTVFEITPTGNFKTLYNFCSQSGCTDGQGPIGGLIQATDGDLYGTTSAGGIGYGTIYKITPSGSLTTLHSFLNTDGSEPYGTLVQDTNGTFYGTTFIGGANGYGTVYSLSVGSGPFVETVPTSGKVGAAVKILGSSLTGATSVTFNGTAAVFTVVSSSEITTTVPSGATSGAVKVTTPHSMLSSNVPFVIP